MTAYNGGRYPVVKPIEKVKTRQEEIREEVVSRIYRMSRDDLPLGETVDSIFQYLDSQGLVLKVERELPKHPFLWVNEDREVGLCNRTQELMLEADWGAFESLI